MMRTDEFDFVLPESLIAQYPPTLRGTSRLLHVHDDALTDQSFADLASLLRADDLLILNDTRVIKARLFGTKKTGGKIEVLVERVLSNHEVWAQVRASRSP
ncbi:MAG: S-adenosylmethionine:tRNA ribosyltransferase-isomerase, partial [Gallionella sp.]